VVGGEPGVETESSERGDLGVPRRRERTLSRVEERLKVGRMLWVLDEARRGRGEVDESGAASSGDRESEKVLVVGLGVVAAWTDGVDGGKGNAEIETVCESGVVIDWGVVIGESRIDVVSTTSPFGSCSTEIDILRSCCTSAVTALASLWRTDAGNVDDDFRFGGFGRGLFE